MKQLRYIVISAISMLSVYTVFAQEIAADWEHLFCDGNTYAYTFSTFVLTADGGAVVGTAAQNNICLEKNEPGAGGMDYWVYKIDSLGNIVWQNVIGGSGDDYMRCINPTSDGGYIVAGISNSPVSGDKTEPRQDLTYPYSNDIWIIKLDNAGNIVWQNTIGGNGEESNVYIEQVPGSGYIVGISSHSPISGDKMEGTVGGTGNCDYWIIKLNNTGSIVWQNTIGGNDNDVIASVHSDPSGGFICIGTSTSLASGDKTEGPVGAYGTNDYWVVKLNNTGSITWQKTLGGLNYDYASDIICEDDGTYTIGGTSNADDYLISYQIMRISHTGNKLWWHTLVAPYSYLRSIEKTQDGGYILGGNSMAGVGGDKTDPNNPMNAYGWEGWDLWVVKTDSFGNHVWDKAVGSGDDDGEAFVRETVDQKYLLIGSVGIDEEGDISDKSSLYPGTWIARLKQDLCVPTVELCNALDDNCNGIIDDGVVESITVAAGGPLTFCNGGSVILTATSYTGTSLQWKKNGEDIPGATNLTYTASAKGTYTCQTTSACSFAISSWMVVDVYKSPTASITAGGPTTFCTGGSVVLTETPSGGCTYQWYKGAAALPGATSTAYTATVTGNYKCRVTKTVSGCYKNSNVIAVSVPCRDENISELSFFEIYPNPANNFITITCSTISSDPHVFIITDVTGKMVATFNMQEQATVDISNYASGIYFIRMDDGGNTFVTKFVKQ